MIFFGGGMTDLANDPWFLSPRVSYQQSFQSFFDPKARHFVERWFQKGFSGVVTADEAFDIKKHGQMNPIELGRTLAEAARTFSRSGVSNFKVGAALESKAGNFYLGTNGEFSGGALSLTIHAEQAAITRGIGYEQEFKRLFVTEFPCGHCRQFMMEFGFDDELVIDVKGTEPLTLKALLPFAFGPLDLGKTHGALHAGGQKLRPKDELAHKDPLVIAAWNAAERSYAPYTGAYAGIAMQGLRGWILGASYWENAAFNPSISLFQSAMIELMMRGLRVNEVQRVVVFCREGFESLHQNSGAEFWGDQALPLEGWCGVLV